MSRLFTDSRDYGRRDGPLTVATAAGTGGSVASPHDGHRDQSYGTVAYGTVAVEVDHVYRPVAQYRRHRKDDDDDDDGQPAGQRYC